jgi:hypothetical protein
MPIMSITAQNLKARAAQAKINLDKLNEALDEKFSEVESASLISGMGPEELKAFRFFQSLVASHHGTISEVNDIFTLCIAAHEEYSDAMKLYRVLRVVVSIKFASITIVGAVLFAAYKIIGGP